MVTVPRFSAFVALSSMAAVGAVFWFGGWIAGLLAVWAWLGAGVSGHQALRAALYRDGGYVCERLPDGRGQHGVKRWRVGVLSAPIDPALNVQWIEPAKTAKGDAR